MIKPDEYFDILVRTIGKIDLAEVSRAAQLINTAWQKGKQIICFGNGGSALTAQHYITDWNKSVYLKTGRPFLGRCLVDNIGLVTAYANDLNYEDIFIAQMRPLLQPEDLVIGISGSGNSENVLRAIEYGRKHGAITLGIVGYDGGKLKMLAEHSVWIPVDNMQITEDLHLAFGHIVMFLLCQNNSVN